MVSYVAEQSLWSSDHLWYYSFPISSTCPATSFFLPGWWKIAARHLTYHTRR